MSIIAFLAAAAYWPGWNAAEIIPRQAVIAIGIPLVCRLNPRNVWAPAGWLLLCGFAWASIRCQSAEAAFLLASLSIAFVGAADLEGLDGPMTGFALGLGASLLVCIAQVFGWMGIPQAPGAEPAGLFYNREILAEFAGPVLVWAALRRHMASVLICAALVALTQSRIAALSAAVGLLYAWRASWSLKAFAAATIIGLAAAVTFLDPAKLASAWNRIGIWREGLAQLSLFGRGIGWYLAAYPQRETAHSDLLQMGIEMGIGAALFVSMPLLILGRRRGTDVERAVFVAACCECAVSFPLHAPADGLVVALVAGYLAGRGRSVSWRAHDGRTGVGDVLSYSPATRRALIPFRRGALVVSVRP